MSRTLHGMLTFLWLLKSLLYGVRYTVYATCTACGCTFPLYVTRLLYYTTTKQKRISTLLFYTIESNHCTCNICSTRPVGSRQFKSAYNEHLLFLITCFIHIWTLRTSCNSGCSYKKMYVTTILVWVLFIFLYRVYMILIWVLLGKVQHHRCGVQRHGTRRIGALVYIGCAHIIYLYM